MVYVQDDYDTCPKLVPAHAKRYRVDESSRS